MRYIEDASEIDYSIDLDGQAVLKEGAVTGWLYLTDGRPGPARAVQVVAYTDAEGHGFVDVSGDWQDVTVTDD